MLDQALRRKACIIHYLSHFALGINFGTTLFLLFLHECRKINRTFTKFL